MMEYKVNKTRDGIKKYPIHCHEEWEVMCYIEGIGIMNTQIGKIDFDCGTIIAIPPGMKHGSESKHGFKNIAIEADFSLFFDGKLPITVTDTASGEAITLARMIWENRYGDKAFVNSLIQSLACLMKSKTAYNDPIKKTVYEIRNEICRQFADTEFRPEILISKSGYAPDYIRNRFKQIIGYTPVQLLNLIRISEAVRIFEIYGRFASVSHTAELCGFADPVYFSRCFKSVKGISPQKYKTTVVPT